MSKWPWVPREMYEETKRQLEAVEKERTRLLDLLLGAGGRPAPNREPSQAPSPVPMPTLISLDVDDGIRPVTENRETEQQPQGFATPFDRTLNKFDREFGGGKTPPAQFKARVH